MFASCKQTQCRFHLSLCDSKDKILGIQTIWLIHGNLIFLIEKKRKFKHLAVQYRTMLMGLAKRTQKNWYVDHLIKHFEPSGKEENLGEVSGIAQATWTLPALVLWQGMKCQGVNVRSRDKPKIISKFSEEKENDASSDGLV